MATPEDYCTLANFEKVLHDEHSPSGRYHLRVSRYTTGARSWACTQGVVTDTTTGAARTVTRNYHCFPYAWIENPGADAFLICGRDYQSLTVLNVATGQERTFFLRWCAASFATWSPTLLAVHGCFWGGSYHYRLFDVSNLSAWFALGPDEVPPDVLENDAWDMDGTWAYDAKTDSLTLTEQFVRHKDTGVWAREASSVLGKLADARKKAAFHSESGRVALYEAAEAALKAVWGNAEHLDASDWAEEEGDDEWQATLALWERVDVRRSKFVRENGVFVFDPENTWVHPYAAGVDAQRKAQNERDALNRMREDNADPILRAFRAAAPRAQVHGGYPSQKRRWEGETNTRYICVMLTERESGKAQQVAWGDKSGDLRVTDPYRLDLPGSTFPRSAEGVAQVLHVYDVKEA